jgi:hypothetical protein
MQISWKHDHTYLDGSPDIGKKIDVFEAMMSGWQLDIADLIINGGRDHEHKVDVPKIPHSAFAALQVALVYFETIAKYEAGDTGKESKKNFVNGVLSVFPEVRGFPYSATEDFLSKLYSGARCGLYHFSMTAPGISVASTGNPITFSETTREIVIDPHALIPKLKAHFAAYIKSLRDTSNTQLRKNFEKCFDHSRKS